MWDLCDPDSIKLRRLDIDAEESAQNFFEKNQLVALLTVSIYFSRNWLHIYGLIYKRYVKRKVGIKYGNKKSQQFQKENYWPGLFTMQKYLIKLGFVDQA